MKNLVNLGSVLGLASLLLLFSSCTKNMEDLNSRTNQDPAYLTTEGGCSPAVGDYISLFSHRQGEKPYFWRGGNNDYPAKVPEANKQYFNGSDFSNQQFFVITATGGNAIHDPMSGRIGVNDYFINSGQQLVMTLSDCLLPDVVMKSFTITLNGGSQSRGFVEMWCDGVLRGSVEYVGRDNPATPGKGTANFPVEYIAKAGQYCFSQLIIKPTEGRVSFVGYQRNGNRDKHYEATRFHLVPRPSEGN